MSGYIEHGTFAPRGKGRHGFWAEDCYTDAEGGLWRISSDCPPIPTRSFDWCATHDDYEPGDPRVVYASTRIGAVVGIDDHVLEAKAERHWHEAQRLLDAERAHSEAVHEHLETGHE